MAVKQFDFFGNVEEDSQKRVNRKLFSMISELKEDHKFLSDEFFEFTSEFKSRVEEELKALHEKSRH